MSQTTFSIFYDGPSLRDGVMDVRDLAPALMSVGQLFDAANTVLNSEQVSVNVNVRATGEGSFEIFLELAQTYGQQLSGLLSGDTITAALNLKELVLVGAGGVGGLIWLVKKLKGRKPDKIEKIDGGRVRVTIGDETFEVPMKLLQLYQDLPVRDALHRLVEKPLKSDGVDTFGVNGKGGRELTVTEAESEYFAQPEVPIEVLVEDTRRAAFSIVSLAFKEDNKWRLHDGNAPISALISDENFLYRVDTNQISFAKGDVLICEVRMTQTRGREGLKTEYVVEHVVEHKPAGRQMALFFSQDEQSEDEPN